MTLTTSKVFAGAIATFIFAAFFISLAGGAEAAGTCVRPPLPDSQLRLKFNSVFN